LEGPNGPASRSRRAASGQHNIPVPARTTRSLVSAVTRLPPRRPSVTQGTRPWSGRWCRASSSFRDPRPGLAGTDCVLMGPAGRRIDTGHRPVDPPRHVCVGLDRPGSGPRYRLPTSGTGFRWQPCGDRSTGLPARPTAADAAPATTTRDSSGPPTHDRANEEPARRPHDPPDSACPADHGAFATRTMSG
jgi:hypothetical protein